MDQHDQHHPDRPVECSGCQKPPQVIYNEISEGQITRYRMCRECPILQSRLGQPHSMQIAALPKEEEEHKACPQCQTAREMVLMGNPLGCSECYHTFEQEIIAQLLASHKLFALSPLDPSQRQTLHCGRAPQTMLTDTVMLRLTSLREALGEALLREDYEQAAWLRDQIKTLAETHHDEHLS